MQVYFLCTGNSARSQMAEGFAKQIFPEWTIASAGIEQHGLNPRAIQVMAEKGINISTHTSDLIDEAYFNASDLIITLCGDARDKCPFIPAGVQSQHWDLQDPAQATGDEEAILNVFRDIRDDIHTRMQELAQAYASDHLQEYWDIYDANRQLRGYQKQRYETLEKGEFHLVVNAVIFNADGDVLVQQRSWDKLNLPGIWEPLAGGSALAGETSTEAITREINEELGVTITVQSADYVMTFVGDSWFDDVYAVQFNGTLADFTRQESEVAALQFLPLADTIALMNQQKYDAQGNTLMHYDTILLPAYRHVFDTLPDIKL
jgi:arsenate reductase